MDNAIEKVTNSNDRLYRDLSLKQSGDQSLSQQDQFTFLAQKTKSDYEDIVDKFAVPADYVSFLIEGHLDKKSWNENHSRAFMRNLYHFEDSMMSFAPKSQFFTSLDDNDCILLLEENVKLMGNFVIAQYMNAEAGIDQLKWIFGSAVFDISKFTYASHNLFYLN